MRLHSYSCAAADPSESVRVLSVSGEVDFSVEQRFLEAVETAALEAETLVIDLNDVQYMDSLGLRVLVRAHRLMHRRGGSLAVVANAPLIRRILRLTGLDGLFSVCENLEHALARSG
jgi:anti-sigma B factor antagonist